MAVIDLDLLERCTKELVDKLPLEAELPNGAIKGSFSVWLPKPHKLINYNYAREYEGHIDTETAFARAWLRSFPKAKCRQVEIDGFKNSGVPQYVSPGVIEEGVYLDLTSAYASIYEKIGWRTRYVRGKYFGHDEPMRWPFPMNWKVGRSSVVTLARPYTNKRYILNGKQVTGAGHVNASSNPPFVACVNDVLSAIGRIMIVKFGALYVNTDGYIIPKENEEPAKTFVKSLGLNARTKYEGRARIVQAGTWRVGTHSTRNYISNTSGRPLEKVPLTVSEADWVLRRFARLT